MGCLPAARHTLNKTLFKWVLSKDARVTLSPECQVRTIKRAGDGYEVTYLDRRGTNSDGQFRTARAAQVFLAAGVLGTSEILLRSRRDAGLALSDQVGAGFSTNGDFGALAVGTAMMGPDGKPILGADGKPAKASVYPTRSTPATPASRSMAGTTQSKTAAFLRCSRELPAPALMTARRCSP